MDHELEWLRAATPPTREPDELTVRRARSRLLDEIGSDHGIEVTGTGLRDLPIEGTESSEATPTRSGGSRVAVLGSIAAAAAVLAGAALLLRAGDSTEPALEEIADRTADEAVPEPTAGRSEGPVEATDPVSAEVTRPLLLSTQAPLADGQEVALTADGFDGAGSLWIAQCLPGSGADGLDRCDLTTTAHTRVRDDGTVGVEFSVRRKIVIQDEEIDCAVSECEVAAVRAGESLRSAAVRIRFDPESPGQTASLLDAVATRDLVDGQALSVTGTGFEPGKYLVVQCVIGVAERTPNCFERHRAGPSSLAEFVVSDEDRMFSVLVHANRLIDTTVGRIDCAAPASGRCALIVSPVEPRTVESEWLLATLPLHFDPDVDPPALGVGIDPPSRFADLEPVTITVSGVRHPDVVLCAEGRANRCVTLNSILLTQGEQRGLRFTLETELPRIFWAWDGHLHDCVANGPCELRVRARGFPTDPLPLVFDPDAPLADLIEPITAPTGLRRTGEIVSLVYPPARSIIVQLCRSEIGGGEFIGRHCDRSTAAFFEEGFDGGDGFSTGPYIDEDGNLRIDIALYRSLLLADSEVHDCVDDGPCEIVVRSPSSLRQYAPIPLEFDPESPVLEVPTARVSPDDALVDGQEVTVTVGAVEAAAVIDIQLCPDHIDAGRPCASIERHLHDGLDTRIFEVDLPRLTPDPVTGRVHDCLTGCILRVSTDRTSTDVPITFDPDSELRPPPSISIEPATFEPGDHVDVTVTGFDADEAADVETYVCVADRSAATSLFERTAGCGLPEEPLWEREPAPESDGTLRGELVVPASYLRWATANRQSCVTGGCWLVVATPNHRAGFAIAALALELSSNAADDTEATEDG